MKTDSLKRLAVLGLSSEQMSVVLDVLAVELAPMERTRELAAQRQQRYTERHTNVRVTSPAQRHDDVIQASRVLDITSTSKQEVREKDNLTVIQKAPPSKPLEPPGFAGWFEIYPKRAGGSDRTAAAKAFGAALKRTSLQNLLDGAKRYSDFCYDGGSYGTQFVLKARKWLNDHGWENTYETARPNHKQNTIAGGFDIIDRAIAEHIATEERISSGETDTQRVPGLLKIAS